MYLAERARILILGMRILGLAACHRSIQWVRNLREQIDTQLVIAASQ
jgi:hypothetical protein